MNSVAIIKREPAKLNRATSVVCIKATDSGVGRVIEGFATTPDEDRMGDSVNPIGAVFKLPIPLLWNHDSAQPVGKVTHAEVTAKGIRIVATLTSGIARVDDLWKLMTEGIINGLSIGFKGLKHKPRAGGGVNWESWEWLELSVCTIPANSAAGFTVRQGMSDRSAKAPKSTGVKLIGQKRGGVKLITPERRAVKLIPLKRPPVKLINAPRGSAVKLITGPTW